MIEPQRTRSNSERKNSLISAPSCFFSVSSAVKLMETKSQKELAFLYDLYIATDWAERFAALVDEHVELPKEGRALYVAAGTAGHALALKERDEALSLLCEIGRASCRERV